MISIETRHDGYLSGQHFQTEEAATDYERRAALAGATTRRMPAPSKAVAALLADYLGSE